MLPKGVTTIAMSACAHNTQTTETWHHCLGHLNKKHIQWLPNMDSEMTIGSQRAEGGLQCARCLVRKYQRKGSRIPMLTATKKLERVHCSNRI